MSQSSETTSNLEYLGYPCGVFRNNYYTAQVYPDVGVCVAHMHNGVFVQFFPWDSPSETATGHQRYADFIQSKATSMLAENNELFKKWPHFHVEQKHDLLLIKCAVEEGLSQLEKVHATNQSTATDPAAGEAVE